LVAAFFNSGGDSDKVVLSELVTLTSLIIWCIHALLKRMLPLA
jgi:hypothetical protein